MGSFQGREVHKVDARVHRLCHPQTQWRLQRAVWSCTYSHLPSFNVNHCGSCQVPLQTVQSAQVSCRMLHNIIIATRLRKNVYRRPPPEPVKKMLMMWFSHGWKRTFSLSLLAEFERFDEATGTKLQWWKIRHVWNDGYQSIRSWRPNLRRRGVCSVP